MPETHDGGVEIPLRVIKHSAAARVDRHPGIQPRCKIQRGSCASIVEPSGRSASALVGPGRYDGHQVRDG